MGFLLVVAKILLSRRIKNRISTWNSCAVAVGLTLLEATVGQELLVVSV
jgi:hypothetical protein